MIARPARLLPAFLLAIAACGGGAERDADTARAAGDTTRTASTGDGGCAPDNGGITLPAGFCASVFADSVGHARHVAFGANGDVYVNTWSGPYYQDEGANREGGFVVALRDTNRDGRADLIRRFGGRAKANSGGTGIAVHGGWVYADAGPDIVRYRLGAGDSLPTGNGEVVVGGFPSDGSHPQHNFVIDSASGALYANMGSATNSCQRRDRTKESPGIDPCTELRTRAGIWKFDANRPGQRFAAAQRFATGIRNAVGMTMGPDGALWVTQHGRDQLAENWPQKFTPAQGQEQPAEELQRVAQNDDFGWPYCYWDAKQGKRILAPEYGGDGTQVGRCASAKAPAATFPAHWAPNAVAFTRGTMFPAKYRNGAFIAFHGSWNRAPGPQGGYNVVFVPIDGAQAGGEHEVFANGFAGSDRPEPNSARHRPSGIGFGPDGAMYVTDDKGGRVWRIVYRGA